MYADVSENRLLNLKCHQCPFLSTHFLLIRGILWILDLNIYLKRRESDEFNTTRTTSKLSLSNFIAVGFASEKKAVRGLESQFSFVYKFFSSEIQRPEM